MKPEHAIHAITASELDAAKQDFRRNPTTWLARFHARNPELANADSVADGLEGYFGTLPDWKPRLNRAGQRY